MPKPIISRKKKAKNAWYSEGLSFECQQCGNCCSGEPGYIWVSDEEISAISERLNISAEEFKEKFLYKTRGKLSIKERENGDCMLLDENDRKCMVYDIRPVQCRTWPWWDQNIKSPEAWEYSQNDCPGINKGRKHSASFITSELEKDKKSIH